MQGLLSEFVGMLRVPQAALNGAAERAFRLLAEEGRPTDAPERLLERVEALIEVLQVNARAYAAADRVYRRRLMTTTERLEQMLGAHNSLRDAVATSLPLLDNGDVDGARVLLEGALAAGEVPCSM